MTKTKEIKVLLVRVEVNKDELFSELAAKIFIEMDKPGVYVVSVKEITI